ncbi:MAG: STAS domain-containing protein [Actinobacteria bacterium]|nr:STAS domain-containing protein [Actinomycetota bacterium]MBI3686362.1 STAS domain-containing protein [Actinomycetota bacterium]
MDLTLNVHSQGGRTVLEVSGEVDVYTGPTLRDRITALLDGGALDLVIDLGRVEFIDSTGLGVLVGALNRVRDLGGSMVLRCSQERVLKLLRITGLDQVFTVQAVLDPPGAGPAAEPPAEKPGQIPDADGSEVS